MGIKTILVPIDGSKGSFSALDRAIIVANRFGAHIMALHIMLNPAEVASAGYYNIPAKLRKDFESSAEKASTEKAAELKLEFEAHCLKYDIPISDKPTKEGGVSASWHQETGNIDEVLIQYGRVSDVIAVMRPSIKQGTLRRSPMGQAIEAVLMRTGRPVLITPPNGVAQKCERVALAWNDSVESTRALAMTMPWLIEMSEVTILVTKKREPSSKSLLEYLAWHGIKAKLELLDDKGDTVGEAMLNVCSEISADFLIVGGFSHSRARQLLFGGVTYHLLKHSNIVTIMVN